MPLVRLRPVPSLAHMGRFILLIQSLVAGKEVAKSEKRYSIFKLGIDSFLD